MRKAKIKVHSLAESLSLHLRVLIAVGSGVREKVDLAGVFTSLAAFVRGRSVAGEALRRPRRACITVRERTSYGCGGDGRSRSSPHVATYLIGVSIGDGTGGHIGSGILAGDVARGTALGIRMLERNVRHGSYRRFGLEIVVAN